MVTALDSKQNKRYLCACALNTASNLRKCTPIEVILPYYRKCGGRLSELQGPIFDRKLVNDRFQACAVKMFLSVA